MSKKKKKGKKINKLHKKKKKKKKNEKKKKKHGKKLTNYTKMQTSVTQSTISQKHPCCLINHLPESNVIKKALLCQKKKKLLS